MQKILQSATMFGILCFVPTVTLHAETMGTNPRPRPAVTVPVIYEVISAITIFLASV